MVGRGDARPLPFSMGGEGRVGVNDSGLHKGSNYGDGTSGSRCLLKTELTD